MFSRVSGQQPGTWKAYIPLHQPNQFVFNHEKFFVSYNNGIASLMETSGVLEVFNKVSGLSEALPSKLAYVNGKIIIGYNNGNIDLLNELKVKNISGIKNATNLNSKNINNISVIDNKAFISFNSGFSIINIEKEQIDGTGFTGENGNQEIVYAMQKWGDSVFASTESGLKAAALTDNLQDHQFWKKVLDQKFFFSQADKDFLWLADSNQVYQYNGEVLNIVYSTSRIINSLFISNNEILITEFLPGDACITSINKSDFDTKFFKHDKIIHPVDAVLNGDDLWVADKVTGFGKHHNSGYHAFNPNSPYSVLKGDLILKNQVLAGILDSDNNSFGITLFKSGEWKNFTGLNYPLLNEYRQLNSLSFFPGNEDIIAGSYSKGLLGIINEVPVNKNDMFSGINFSEKITGLFSASNGILWMVSENPSSVLYGFESGKQIKTYPIPFNLNSSSATKLFADEEGRVWIIMPDEGLLVFSNNNTPDNPGDDQWRMFSMGKGNGNLPDNHVLSVNSDANGLIWVGTENGIGIITCRGNAVFQNSCDAVIPVVRHGNFAGHLFQNEKVNVIAVNSANQKWIGTDNGAWLISEDGENLIHNFNINNSLILNNKVTGIAINEISGELFFSTPSGLSSYTDIAIQGSVNKNDVLVYPNPVPPDYTGKIYIKGIPANAEFRITETNGKLIFKGKATGGQAEWNGMSLSGKRVSTGIYLILVSTEEKRFNLAAKIVYIKK